MSRNSAQLEQKIESLVTLLSAAQGSVTIGRPESHLELPSDGRHVNHLGDYSWSNGPASQVNGSPGGLDGNSSGRTTDAPSPAESTSGMPQASE